MIAVLDGPAGHERDWRLIGRSAGSADLLARIVAGEKTPTLRLAVRRLVEGDGHLVVDGSGDGHFRWRFVSTEGVLLAESPPVYRDEQACRDGFATTQQAAQLV
ncbi:hypothetical protein ODJ79_27685 [Actinoplanes sp. KI2]|uniref:hypothetical protein n=1 Tax=Actinoplanes sp. KI2 TaxID=2983315 RepID=UPI0021D5F6E2|nr:hypothetical protein [Actinoplanes sp. KI2]MCU7727517.1 hypothetical protein [Actinoplanes sp. KI2]